MARGTVKAQWEEFRGGWRSVSARVIEEASLRLFVNGELFTTFLCTPRDQDLLALGFLRNEGLIEGLSEVRGVHVSADGCCVDVWLDRAIPRPERRVITSGCGGGTTLEEPTDGLPPVEDGPTIRPDLLFGLFRELQQRDSLYARARGVHAAGLAADSRLIMVYEDIGRHNAVDKIVGACLVRGIDPRRHILISTGRISAEMARKAARMGCGIVASRTSPTSLAVELARSANITLVGYVRQGSFRVYAHPERLASPRPAREGGGEARRIKAAADGGG